MDHATLAGIAAAIGTGIAAYVAARRRAAGGAPGESRAHADPPHGEPTRDPGAPCAGCAELRREFVEYRERRERERGEHREALHDAVNAARDAARIDVAALREIVVDVETDVAALFERTGGAPARRRRRE